MTSTYPPRLASNRPVSARAITASPVSMLGALLAGQVVDVTGAWKQQSARLSRALWPGLRREIRKRTHLQQ